MTNTDVVKAAIYIRVSTEEQASPGKTSLGQQQERAEAFCQSQHWEIAGVYEDAGVSGTLSSRPGLDRMMADAHEGKFQRVVFLKLDRLGRTLRDLLNLSAKLDELGVGIASIHDAFDTGTSSGRLFFSVLGAVAEFEASLIRDRMTSGRLGAARQGHFVGGPAPFGYNYNKEARALVINEAEAAVVRKVYGMYVREGLSHEKIADQLNVAAIPTKTLRVRSEDRQKKGWMHTHIGRMLTNSLYKGTAHYGKTSVNGNTRKPRPKEEWIAIKVPAIVSEKEWEAARRRAKRNRRDSQRPRDKSSPFLLSGLIRCQECGRAMAADTVRTRAGGKRYVYLYYHCTGQHTYKTPCRPAERVKAEEIENRVLGLISETFSDPEKVLTACHAYGDQLRAVEEEQHGVRALLRRQLSNAEAERLRYIELYAKDTITEPEMNKRLAALAAERAKWKEELGRQEEAAEQRVVVSEIEASAHAIAERIKGIMEETTLEERKRIVRALVERVWVDAGNEITVECVVPGLIPDRQKATTNLF